MKDLLCKAFCEQITVRDVPAGLAVSTAFNLSGGEPLGFYIVGPDSTGRYRLEDDGTTIPMIEAVGIDLETPTRTEAATRGRRIRNNTVSTTTALGMPNTRRTSAAATSSGAIG